MEGILDTIGDNGVTSVCTTIESSAHIVVLGEDVDELTLTFVTPLGTEDDGKSGVGATLAASSSVLKQCFLETHEEKLKSD